MPLPRAGGWVLIKATCTECLGDFADPHSYKQVCSSGISWRNSSRSASGMVHDSTALADESCENILWLVKYHAILISPAILYPFSWYLVFIIFTMEVSFTFLLCLCCPVRLINPCSDENTPELYRIFPVAASFPLFSLTCSLMKRNIYDLKTMESSGGNGVWPVCHKSCYLLLAAIIALLMFCWKTATLYGSKITKETKNRGLENSYLGNASCYSLFKLWVRVSCHYIWNSWLW